MRPGITGKTGSVRHILGSVWSVIVFIGLYGLFLFS